MSARSEHAPPLFPRLRWAALVWLAVWVPVYARAWGWLNFLHLCDAAVILTCWGLWRGDSLLLSSQAVSSLFTDVAWCVDAGWRLFLGRHLVGGTEYLWDARYPLLARLLSLFHLVLPALFFIFLRRAGYDRRALRFQFALAAILLVISRLTMPALNLNFAFRDPLFRRAWGPAPVHLLVILAGLVLIFYWPAHRLFEWLFPAPAPDRAEMR